VKRKQQAAPKKRKVVAETSAKSVGTKKVVSLLTKVIESNLLVKTCCLREYLFMNEMLCSLVLMKLKPYSKD
jgi:hypothetical protein